MKFHKQLSPGIDLYQSEDGDEHLDKGSLFTDQGFTFQVMFRFPNGLVKVREVSRPVVAEILQKLP